MTIRPVKNGERGFAMLVVFLMAASIAIALYIEIPRVAFESQRNREELLVERGEQYKRAVELYYRKTKTYPQKIEDLENTNNYRFLRKRYKDPLTGKDEWRLIHMGPAGLTDSLVEKMPGLDGDKDKDKEKKDLAAANDPNLPKGPDDVTTDAARTARDQRALLAQRGNVGGGGPLDPNAPQDPAQQQQMQQVQDFNRQSLPPPGQVLDPNTQNPGAPPSAITLAQNQFPGQVNPFQPPGFPGQNAPPGFPPIGAQNGPVRTLYPVNGGGPPPFNPGNAILRGAIPPPVGSPNPSITGGAKPPGAVPNVPKAVMAALSGGSRSAFGITQNQQFGGAGIAGIASKATGSGIKRYNEHSKYKEWEFVYDYRKPGKGAKKGITGVGGDPSKNPVVPLGPKKP